MPIKTKLNDNFRTPEWLLDLLFPDGKYFDPCPLNPNPEINGLDIYWRTDVPVFINPPWSNPKPWIERALEHPGQIVLLLPMATEAAWWGYREFFHVTIIWDRIKFIGGIDGKPVVTRSASMIWRK